MPTELPLPMAEEGAVLARRHAHRLRAASATRRRSRRATSPGSATAAARRRPIWIANLADSAHRRSSRATTPTTSTRCGSATSVYFLSDRNGPTTLFAYDPAYEGGHAASCRTSGFDIKSASAGSGRHRLRAVRLAAPVRPEDRQVASRSTSRSTATCPASRPQLREGRQARFQQRRPLADRRARRVRGARRDPHRARREGRRPQPDQHARRRRARSGLVARRQVDRLLLRRVRRVRAAPPRARRPRRRPRRSSSATPPSFYYSPGLVARQQEDRLHRQAACNLWYVDLDTRQVRRRSTPTRYYSTVRRLRPRLVAGQHVARLHQAAEEPPAARSFVYSLADRQAHAGHRRHERRPLRRPSTRAASISTSPPAPTSARHRPARHVGIQPPGHAAASTSSCSTRTTPSPLAPESDEEKARGGRRRPTSRQEEGRRASRPTPPPKIDLEDIGQRILALPIPARNYVGLAAGKAGIAVPAREAGR